ncbi:chemotaxis protein CheD [Ramlibacter tataouinensis]|uniref:chemotaxis protein CheD n=1 Tax=Ramlibacter tataouinensis TaxID=94132 RepID=UPI0022F3906C|nr:chemotaxis protein CheD [Ramlibacter tataouinensis]WBY00218.1 chemotaxis protein CheD [Ramlibacter tataouinensis]
MAVLPAPPDVLEVFLQPGELWFGDEKTRIRTVLGSCVAIVLWHPQRRIGGMCHFMLPSRPRARAGDEPLDGRYGDEAMELLLRELRRTGTGPADYQAKLFGGGCMFGPREGAAAIDVSRRNMEAGRTLLERAGFRLLSHDLGGEGHRNVIFDVWSGDVWLRRAQSAPAVAAPGRPWERPAS